MYFFGVRYGIPGTRGMVCRELVVPALQAARQARRGSRRDSRTRAANGRAAQESGALWRIRRSRGVNNSTSRRPQAADTISNSSNRTVQGSCVNWVGECRMRSRTHLRPGDQTRRTEEAFAVLWIPPGSPAVRFPLRRQCLRSACRVRAAADGFPVGMRGRARTERGAPGGG